LKYGVWVRTQLSDKQIIKALAGCGDLTKIRSYLNRGWNPNSALEGSNPLNVVDRAAAAALLIKAGADVNSSFKWLPPLCLHAASGNKDIVALLLKHGADPNQVFGRKGQTDTAAGTTPLMKAASHGHFAIAKLLLAAGANINARDEFGHSALFYACYWTRRDIANELLARGAELPPDILLGPVLNGQVALVQLLLKKGANPNYVTDRLQKKDPVRTRASVNLLEYAIRQSDVPGLGYSPKIAELLIDHGADVNVHFLSYGRATPLSLAASNGDTRLVERLIKAGADVNRRDSVYASALDRACFGGHVGVVKLLLKAGAAADQPGIGGKKPLQLASETGHSEIIELLSRSVS
jgi:ankyrin repeat protein